MPSLDSASDKDQEQLKDSLIWGTLLSGAIRIGQILVSLVLIRLLSAEAYGQFGVISAILGVMYVLSMQRFMEHSFYQRQDELDLDSQLGFGALLHVGLFVLTNLISCGLLFSEQYAELTVYLSVASLGFLINIARIFHSVLLQRESQWRRIRLLHLCSFGVSSSVAIGLAWQGFGLWALVVHALLVPVPFVIDGVRRLLQIQPVWPGDHFLPTIRFGFVRNMTAGVNAIQLLTESGMLSSLLGFAAYGVFGRALTLAQLLSNAVTQPLLAILYPVLAADSTTAAQRRDIVGLLLRVSLWIGIPATLLLCLFPFELVSLVFGQNWLDVGSLLPLAALLVLGQGLRQVLTMVLISQLLIRHVLGLEVLVLCMMLAVLSTMQGSLEYYLQVMALVYWSMSFWLAGVLIVRGDLVVKDCLTMVAALLLALGLALPMGWYSGQIVLASPWQWAPMAMTGLWSVLSMVLGVRLVDAEALRRLVDYLPGATIWRLVLRF